MLSPVLSLGYGKQDSLMPCSHGAYILSPMRGRNISDSNATSGWGLGQAGGVMGWDDEFWGRIELVWVEQQGRALQEGRLS